MKTTKHGPLTATSIDALRPGTERFEVKDSRAPGLQLRVTPSGSKTFRRAVRDAGKLRWITLGEWAPTPTPGRVTLHQAREWSDRLKEAASTGQIGAVEADLRSALAPPPPPVTGVTVREVAADFLRALDRKRPEHAERPIRCDILPAIGDRAIVGIVHQDVRRIVESVVAREAPVQARVVLAVTKQLFRFALQRGDIETNPAERFTNPRVLGVVTKNERQRVLSSEEIRAFWLALDAYRGLSPTVRNGLKLLLLTGVRSGELLRARLADFDLKAETWTVPPEHQKLTRAREAKARPWIVPLAPTALRLVEELHALAKSMGSPHLMASFHGEGAPVTDKSLIHAMRRLPWKYTGDRPTPHDLRRTVRTGLGTLGVPWHVAECCLNHSLGTIAATYDLSDRYLAERRAALEKWGAEVGRLVA